VAVAFDQKLIDRRAEAAYENRLKEVERKIQDGTYVPDENEMLLTNHLGETGGVMNYVIERLKQIDYDIR
jgi:hypothetical protein